MKLIYVKYVKLWGRQLPNWSPNWTSLVIKISFQYLRKATSNSVAGQRGYMGTPKQSRLFLRLLVSLHKLIVRPYC